MTLHATPPSPWFPPPTPRPPAPLLPLRPPHTSHRGSAFGQRSSTRGASSWRSPRVPLMKEAANCATSAGTWWKHSTRGQTKLFYHRCRHTQRCGWKVGTRKWQTASENFFFFFSGGVGWWWLFWPECTWNWCVCVCFFFSFLTDREILYAVTSLRSITFYSRRTFRKTNQCHSRCFCILIDKYSHKNGKEERGVDIDAHCIYRGENCSVIMKAQYQGKKSD